jgi:hypothetical protein
MTSNPEQTINSLIAHAGADLRAGMMERKVTPKQSSMTHSASEGPPKQNSPVAQEANHAEAIESVILDHADISATAHPRPPASLATRPPGTEVTHNSAKAIFIPGAASISDTARELFITLAARQTLFLRGGGVVELVFDGDGRPRIAPIGAAAARSRFESGVRWYKPTANGPMPTILKEDDAKALLEAKERAMLPWLETLLHSPALIEKNGELITLRPGYNSEIGVWVTGEGVPETVPLHTARFALCDTLLGGFEFATPHDKSRALAAVLTPALVAGRLLPGRVGLTLLEADQSQTGKGYLVKLVAAVYGEVPTCFSKSKGGVGSFDEAFDQALIWGRPIISLENVRGALDSQKLESFLTEPTYAARIPYQQAMSIDPRRHVLFVTSNGAHFTVDLANRCLFVRLRKRQGHVFRQFAEGDLLAHVTARQRFFLGCVHTVVRAWHAADKPRTTDIRHDFRAWTQACDWMIQTCLDMPPLLEGHVELMNRATLRFLGFLRQLAILVARRGNLGRLLRARDLLALAMEHDVEVPFLKPGNELDGNLGVRAVGMALARAFEAANQVTVDDFVVTRTELETDEISHHASRCYVFARRAG